MKNEKSTKQIYVERTKQSIKKARNKHKIYCLSLQTLEYTHKNIKMKNTSANTTIFNQMNILFVINSLKTNKIKIKY